MKNIKIKKDILYFEGDINNFCNDYEINKNDFNNYFEAKNNEIFIKANQNCEIIYNNNSWPSLKFNNNNNLIFDIALNNDELKNYIEIL